MIDQIAISDVLLDGTKEIFETMIFMDLEPVENQDRDIEGDSLLGSITFTGDLEGCVSICCSTNSAATIAANMLGLDEPEELSEEEVCDAVGEVTNMIMGSVKARPADIAGNVEVSIPSVVSGRSLESTLGEKASRTSVMVSLSEQHIAELSMFWRNRAK